MLSIVLRRFLPCIHEASTFPRKPVRKSKVRGMAHFFLPDLGTLHFPFVRCKALAEPRCRASNGCALFQPFVARTHTQNIYQRSNATEPQAPRRSNASCLDLCSTCQARCMATDPWAMATPSSIEIFSLPLSISHPKISMRPPCLSLPPTGAGMDHVTHFWLAFVIHKRFLVHRSLSSVLNGSARHSPWKLTEMEVQQILRRRVAKSPWPSKWNEKRTRGRPPWISKRIDMAHVPKKWLKCGTLGCRPGNLQKTSTCRKHGSPRHLHVHGRDRQSKKHSGGEWCDTTISKATITTR